MTHVTINSHSRVSMVVADGLGLFDTTALPCAKVCIGEKHRLAEVYVDRIVQKRCNSIVVGITSNLH